MIKDGDITTYRNKGEKRKKKKARKKERMEKKDYPTPDMHMHINLALVGSTGHIRDIHTHKQKKQKKIQLHRFMPTSHAIISMLFLAFFQHFQI